MGPLQESLAKALPPPSSPPSSARSKTTHAKSKSAKQQATTMQWHDNVSSYRCFETIATPSPIPITKSGQNQSLHRSTSLDSLANSEANHSDNSSQNSWCDTDSECLSHCDSITDSKEPDSDLNAQENVYETYCNESTATDHEKPVVTELVKKKTPDTLCENRNCAYRQFEQHHSIDDCAPNTDLCEADDGQSKENSSNAPFLLNKTRRTSVASSGSVSRMETIVEEPIEPKISVKEILARFETLTSIEVCHSQFFFIVFVIRSFIQIAHWVVY